MNVVLDPSYENFVKRLVETGRFASEREVLEAGVARLMLDGVDQVEEIDDASTASIAKSEQDIAQGRARSVDDAVAELRRKHFG